MRAWIFPALGLLLGAPPVQAACDCPPATAQDQLDLATYVFSGQVADVKTDKVSGQVMVQFDVVDTYKGKPQDPINMADFMATTDCRLNFKEGDAYLVYARWQWGATFTSRCWGTKLLKQAGQEDAKVLGPGQAWKSKMYEQLQEKCMGRRDTVCCLSSVRTMSQGSYLLEPEDGCPEGFIPDRMPCDGSYHWCIPIADAGQRKSEGGKPAAH